MTAKTTRFSRLKTGQQISIIKGLCKKTGANLFIAVEVLQRVNPIVSIWKNRQLVLKCEEIDLYNVIESIKN